jgi:predicted GIY-YIG superfamily endonuclease
MPKLLKPQPEQDLFFRAEQGLVYLLHFTRPVGGRASHYIGWTLDLDRRLQRHRRKRKKSNTVAFTRAAAKQGIDFAVAQTWHGVNRSFERYLKQQKNAKRYCPICQLTWLEQLEYDDPLPDVHIPLYL